MGEFCCYGDEFVCGQQSQEQSIDWYDRTVGQNHVYSGCIKKRHPIVGKDAITRDDQRWAKWKGVEFEKVVDKRK